MARRAVPAGLVVVAAFAEGSGSARLAFYAFLALVVAAASIGLTVYGEIVEAPAPPKEDTPRRLQALLWVALLALAVVGSAARAPLVGHEQTPRLAVTALIACLLVLCVEGIVEVVTQARPRTPVEPVARLPVRRYRGSDEAASRARSISG